MTFDDDFIQLPGGIRILCKVNGINWPPPQRLRHAGDDYVRISMSALTDQDRKECTFVVRGAAYALDESNA